MPLFLFHLLEYMDVDYTIDVEEINERWHNLAGGGVWAQLIMKEPNDSVERILSAPRTGTYRLDENAQLSFLRVSHDWHPVTSEDECFYLRVYAPGGYASRARTSAFSSPNAACRPRRDSVSAAAITSAAFVPITSASRSSRPRPPRLPWA